MGATNCCANKKSPEGISPSAHLADGCIDLVVVRHTSRARYLHHMIRLAGRADHVSTSLHCACLFRVLARKKVLSVKRKLGKFF